jgi:hypothetical protein
VSIDTRTNLHALRARTTGRPPDSRRLFSRNPMTNHHHLAWPYRTLQSPLLPPRHPTGRRRTHAPAPEEISIRLATARDAQALARLADLDSAPPLDGAAVLAERDGEVIAAVALDDRRSAADPFAPTHDVLELLAMRAEQIAAAVRGRRAPRRARIRFWAREGTA